MSSEIGRIAAIWRFPVKSMRGERLAAAELRWSGLDGDRQYAFYRAGDGSRFPWLSGRDLAELVLYEPRYAEPANPRRSPLEVAAPDGTQYGINDGALAARLASAAGRELRLLQLGRGAFDSMPVSVVARRTIEAVGARLGRALEETRFRANIVVDAFDGSAERDWLGATLVFGESEGAPRLRVNRPIPRCRMITIDPATGAKDPAIIETVAAEFMNEIGVYCAPEAVGALSVGDPVRLVR
ncbi:MAG TPA: MOSC N-terminal beta barrel domain-containing protein [Stellaceae bacterium]|nr:MOSC N-terminal beta barrel domain-containing protein [Stellaceae bacterium]